MADEEEGKSRGASHLINIAAVKRYALEHVKKTRPAWDVKQVSKEFIDAVEANTRVFINARLHQAGTKGATIR